MQPLILSHKTQRLILISALNVFGISTLYKLQMDVCVKLVMMKFRDLSTVLAPDLFVKKTGGGKTLVRDIYSVMIHGVSLTFVLLLALGADRDDGSVHLLLLRVQCLHTSCSCDQQRHGEEHIVARSSQSRRMPQRVRQQIAVAA